MKMKVIIAVCYIYIITYLIAVVGFLYTETEITNVDIAFIALDSIGLIFSFAVIFYNKYK